MSRYKRPDDIGFYGLTKDQINDIKNTKRELLSNKNFVSNTSFDGLTEPEVFQKLKDHCIDRFTHNYAHEFGKGSGHEEFLNKIVTTCINYGVCDGRTSVFREIKYGISKLQKKYNDYTCSLKSKNLCIICGHNGDYNRRYDWAKYAGALGGLTNPNALNTMRIMLYVESLQTIKVEGTYHVGRAKIYVEASRSFKTPLIAAMSRDWALQDALRCVCLDENRKKEEAKAKEEYKKMAAEQQKILDANILRNFTKGKNK
jgi:hypothetical protein